MDNICFEIKKCVRNAFSNDLEIQIYWRSKQWKKLNFWEKTAVDKSAWIKAYVGELAVHVRKGFLDMPKNRMWQSTYF